MDGQDYIVTANEGDDLEYGGYEERVRGRNIFQGTSIGYVNMTADAEIFSSSSITEGTSRFFNANCDETNVLVRQSTLPRLLQWTR